MDKKFEREYSRYLKRNRKEHELRTYKALFNGIRHLEYDENGEVKFSLKRRFLIKIIKFLESIMT